LIVLKGLNGLGVDRTIIEPVAVLVGRARGIVESAVADDEPRQAPFSQDRMKIPVPKLDTLTLRMCYNQLTSV